MNPRFRYGYTEDPNNPGERTNLPNYQIRVDPTHIITQAPERNPPPGPGFDEDAYRRSGPRFEPNWDANPESDAIFRYLQNMQQQPMPQESSNIPIPPMDVNTGGSKYRRTLPGQVGTQYINPPTGPNNPTYFSPGVHNKPGQEEFDPAFLDYLINGPARQGEMR